MNEATSGATIEAPVQDETTGPPVVILAVAAIGILAGIALLLVGSLAANVAGYVLSSVVVILAVGLFRRVDLQRRLSSGYTPSTSAGRLIPLLLVAAFVVTGCHVWAIATELAS